MTGWPRVGAAQGRVEVKVGGKSVPPAPRVPRAFLPLLCRVVRSEGKRAS